MLRNLKRKKHLLSTLIFSFILIGFPSYAALTKDLSVELYLAPNQSIQSSSPNSLSLSNNELVLIANDGLKKPIHLGGNFDDSYLTLVYLGRKDKLNIYNHSQFIESIDLRSIDLDIWKLVSFLEETFKREEISYLNILERSLNSDKVKQEYNKTYGKVRIEQSEELSGIAVINQFQLSPDATCDPSDIVWDGDGTSNNWNDAPNWSNDQVPTSNDTICFDATSSKNAISTTDIEVKGLKIVTGYSGAIQYGTNLTTTIGTDGFLQEAGVHTLGTGNFIVKGDFTQTGGTLNHNNGTITLSDTGTINTTSTLNNLAIGHEFDEVIIDDRFPGSSGVDLINHTPSVLGDNWKRIIQQNSGTLERRFNRAEPLASGGSRGALYEANITADAEYNSANYEVSIRQQNGDTGDDANFLAARIQSNGDMYVVKWNETASNGITFFKRVSGSWSTIKQCANLRVVDGSIVKFIVNGSDLDFEDDGVITCSTTDSSISGAGKAGIGQGNIGIPGFTTNDLSAQRMQNFLVTLNSIDIGMTTLASSLDINGDLTITTGSTLDASASNFAINIASDWSNSGTFTPREGSVIFDGTNQALNGDTSFYGFTKSATSANTLTFEVGKTQTVTNSLTLAGASAANKLSLVSSSNGTQWAINPPETRNISNVSVEDSNNIGVLLDVSSGGNTDNGNNTNWCFNSCPSIAKISISGKVFDSDKTTPLGNQTVRIAVNGFDTAITAESNATTGAYSLSDIFVAGGSIIAAYLEDESSNAVTITVTDATNISNLDLHKDHLTIYNHNSGSTTNSDLSTGTVSSEDDISGIYSVSSGALIVSDGISTFIPAGHTFKPGGDITVNDIRVNGGINLEANNAVVKGDFNTTGGTVNSTGTVFFTGLTSTVNSTATFNDVSIGQSTLQEIFRDTFTSAVSTELSSHAPDIGANWTSLISIGGGALRSVNGDVRRFSGGSSDGALYIANIEGNADYSSANYIIQLRQLNGDTSDDANFLAARIQTNGDMYVVKWNETTTNGIRFFKRVSGNWTQIKDCPNLRVIDNSIVKFTIDDNVLSFEDDGVIVCEHEDTVDPITEAGRAGLGAGNLGIPGFTFNDLSSQRHDDFSVNLILEEIGDITLASSLDVDRDLTITDIGTLDVSASNFSINVAGFWTNEGSFNPRNGTVTFDGVNQRIFGDNSFNNFTKEATGPETLSFEGNSLQLIGGTTTLKGQNATNKLFLLSVTPGTPWEINSLSTRDISNVFVMDSNNVGIILDASDGGTDAGNNTNWCFSNCPTVSLANISGNVYDTDGITPLANKTVRVAVNGFDAATAETNASGAYSISNILVVQGIPITAYLEDETENAITFSVSDGTSDLTGIDLRKDNVTIRNDNNSSTSNSDITTGLVSSEDDISSLIVKEGAGINVIDGITTFIPAGHEFKPAGLIDLDDLENEGTLTLEGNEASIRGNINSPVGTISSTGTVYLSNTSSINTNSSFNNLNIGRDQTIPIFEDIFTSVFFTELSMHTPTTQGESWEELISIGGGKLGALSTARRFAASSSDGALYLANVDGSNDYTSADYTVSVRQVNGDTSDDLNELAARVQQNGDMYIARWNESTVNGIRLYKRISGVWTLLQNCVNQRVTDGSTVEFSVLGNTLDFKDDGVSLCSITDSSITTAGRAGIGQGNIGITGEATDDLSSQQLDDFTVTLNKVASANTSVTNTLMVGGNLTIDSGSILTVSASNFDIILDGNWNNQGTFNHGNGRLTLNGSNQSFNGSTAFFNVDKRASGTDTLTFESGETQTIDGTLLLHGESSTNKLSLISSSPGTQWRIDPKGDRSLKDLNVTDSNNINATAIPAGNQNITSGGNNTNWDFGTPQIDVPTITNVTSTNANGSYVIGDIINILVTFSDPVEVFNLSPTISLNAGNGAVASFVSGVDTNTLLFQYNVGAGQSSTDLDYSSTTSLVLNGSTITSTTSGQNVDLTLPTPGTAGSLGANKNIAINATTSSNDQVGITAPLTGESTSNGSFNVAGIAPTTATTVELLIVETGQVLSTSASGGNWNVSLPGLAAGTYTITAIAFDTSGIPINSSTAVSITITP